MELYQEILAKMLSQGEVRITFPDFPISPEKMVEIASCEALNQIKAVIQDDSLNDAECFAKIEEIICILEAFGCDGGCRHDFG